MTSDLWAVIPSGNRLIELKRLVYSLVNDGVNVVIVDTGYAPDVWGEIHPDVFVLRDVEQPQNISRWWNLGLKYVHARTCGNDYVVAVLNDDVIVPTNFVMHLANAIHLHNVDAAYPDVYNMGRDFVCRTIPGGPRMAGFAFALRGSAGIRADESLTWWYGDNDIDWRARAGRGTVSVGGLGIQHLYANSTTVGELAEQAGRDRETFTRKWGQPPW